MLFQNKWANVLLYVAIAVAVTVVVVKSMKVLDAAGKDTGDNLAFKETA